MLGLHVLAKCVQSEASICVAEIQAFGSGVDFFMTPLSISLAQTPNEKHEKDGRLDTVF